jgi:hypothetical protein
MAKTVSKLANGNFRLGNKKYNAKSPNLWVLTLEDIPDNEVESEIELFAMDVREFKFEDIDFIFSRI